MQQSRPQFHAIKFIYCDRVTECYEKTIILTSVGRTGSDTTVRESFFVSALVMV